MDTYITRLCWNENGWKKPSGAAAKLEHGTFNVDFGFGFEEWFFSSKFEIDGWRYGFIQGANKSQNRLAGKDIDVFFFTIGPEKQRYFVSEIQPCHILNFDETTTAHTAFEKKGMIDQMIEDVKAVGGDANFIKDKLYIHKWAFDIFNIRYKPEQLCIYRDLISVPSNCIVWNWNRYQLIRVNDDQIKEWIR